MYCTYICAQVYSVRMDDWEPHSIPMRTILIANVDDDREIEAGGETENTRERGADIRV